MFYFIYDLLDPVEPFYVGITSKPNARLSQHLAEGGCNEFKHAKIREIYARGGKVKMRILQTIEEDDALECRNKARKAETEWVKHYLSTGVHLTNVSLVPQIQAQIRIEVASSLSIRTDVPFWDIDHPELVNRSVMDMVVGDQIEDDLVISEVRRTGRVVAFHCIDLHGKEHWQRYQHCVKFHILPRSVIAS